MLVLDDAGEEGVVLELVLVAFEVLVAHLRAHGAVHVGEDVGEAQATLVELVALLRAGR